MARDDGGPAFPVSQNAHEEGMSLRDWFAGQALKGLLAKHGDAGWCERGEVKSTLGAAQTCYDYADAMLEARK